MSEQQKPFNPNEHLMLLKSKEGPKEYLPVQWRLVWFRSECPNGTIKTEIVHLDFDREIEAEVKGDWNPTKKRYEMIKKTGKGTVIFRATIKDGKGGMATGTKQENILSFADWLEKAETGAIGRALAGLGYGTQFTGDELEEGRRIVDSPIDREETPPASYPQGNTTRPAPAPAPPQPKPQPKAVATTSQAPKPNPAPAPKPEAVKPTAPVVNEPTPITKELLVQRQKKINTVKNQASSDDWSDFCKMANVHPGDTKDWPEEAFTRASQVLLQYKIMPSMQKRIFSWAQTQDIGTITALGCPPQIDVLETITALDAAEILDKIMRYSLMVELAKVYDWGANANDHYAQLKAIGVRDSLSLDEPIDLFTLEKETGNLRPGEEYRNILKDRAQKNPKGRDSLPKDFCKEYAKILNAIFKTATKPAA